MAATITDVSDDYAVIGIWGPHARETLAAVTGDDVSDAALPFRSARNIDGVVVAPVSEFNTYDVLKQRYLILTRDALNILKVRGKDSPAPDGTSTRTRL